jgi:hypothetical protein
LQLVIERTNRQQSFKFFEVDEKQHNTIVGPMKLKVFLKNLSRSPKREGHKQKHVEA